MFFVPDFFLSIERERKTAHFFVVPNTPSGEMLTELDQSLSRHAYIRGVACYYLLPNCCLTWYIEKFLPRDETRVVHKSKKVRPGDP